MTLKVDIWSDIACPWCYIGQARFAAGAAKFAHADQIEVAWHSYQLDPTLPERFDGTEVDYLVAAKGMPRAQVEQMMAGVAAAAEGEGLPIDFGALVPANSLKAHHLLKTIGRNGGDVDAAEHALFSAHFAKGEAISDTEVLTRIGVEAGLTEEQVESGLADPEIHSEVATDIQMAQAIGVTGVPFFVLGEKYAVSGAQPPEVFTAALEKTWSEIQPEQPKFITLAGDSGDACGPEGCD